MPRRNIAVLAAVLGISLGCYVKVSPYGRVLVFAMNEIERRALQKKDRKELLQGALDGMTRLLDEHSGYFPPREYTAFEEDLDQEFGGIGIQVYLDKRTRQLTVVTPLYGTPAHKAGIRAGDRIVRIDGQGTQGLSLQDAAERMRGKPGEPVTLTIQRSGEPDPLEVKILRDTIQVDSVVGDRRDAEGHWSYFLDDYDKIAYLRLQTFGARTVDELKAILDELTEAGMRGLILDLRNNRGGLLGAAWAACDLFVEEGVIVTTRDRDGRIKHKFDASSKDTFNGFSVAVLVNHLSASASEIVAACLQDHEVAVVVGERSYGKGTVQELIKLDGGMGALKLTTSSYWRPSGRDINRAEGATEKDEWGVKPDPGYEVPLDDEERVRLIHWRNRRDANQTLDPEHDPEALDPDDLAADRALMKALEYVTREADRR